MKKIYLKRVINIKSLVVILFLQLFISCGGGDDGGSSSSSVTPTNLIINSEIVGVTTALPNGDGSGIVNFSVSATNATSYKILIEGQTINSTSGIFNYTFNQAGTNTYTVYVSAYNGSKFISANKNITVYVTPTLAWSDEFDVDGAPNSAKWGYDTGNGGWGNNELQNYTNRPENSIVSGGTLKIITLKEDFGGSNYTSARLKTQSKFSFKYGRVEIRAKLPAGAGTWCALWMLGDNISSLGWPACGEIDIMEHLGASPNVIHGSLHYPGHSGGSADSSSTTISNATSAFHLYSVDWNATTIKFYVDGVLFKTFANSSGLAFNNNFFLIFNNAMGGWGGTVDPAFTSSTYEIDYVRVYQ